MRPGPTSLRLPGTGEGGSGGQEGSGGRKKGKKEKRKTKHTHWEASRIFGRQQTRRHPWEMGGWQTGSELENTRKWKGGLFIHTVLCVNE